MNKQDCRACQNACEALHGKLLNNTLVALLLWPQLATEKCFEVFFLQIWEKYPLLMYGSNKMEPPATFEGAFSERLISLEGYLPSPAPSPDLASCDFFWGYLKFVVYNDHLINLLYLKNNSHNATAYALGLEIIVTLIFNNNFLISLQILDFRVWTNKNCHIIFITLTVLFFDLRVNLSGFLNIEWLELLVTNIFFQHGS